MTQGNPPPIPRRTAPPDSASPLPRIPVAAIPFPSYRQGGPHVGRPGLITAIGIISIVVASLSLLGSLGQVFYVGVFYVMSQSMAARVTPAPPTRVLVPPVTGAYIVPAPATQTSAKGLSPSNRDIVVEGLKRVRNLSPEQEKHLGALLDSNGQDVILLRGAKLTANGVFKNVSDSGALPGADRADGPTYFTLGQGRIEVSDTQAAFFPTRGEVARASFSDTPPPGMIHPSGLSDADVAAAIARVRQIAASPLNAEQIAGLRSELHSGANSLLAPLPSPAETARQILSVTPLGSGQIHIATRGEWVQLDANGAVINASVTATRAPVFNINATATLILIVEAVFSFVLAVYLLAVGILALRQSPRAGRLHLIYAVLKIPLALVSGVGLYLLFTELFGAMPGGGAANRLGFMLSTAMGVVVACIYPVALLITLRTKSVREYYATAGGK